jgi:hypothetical protein
MRLWGPWRRRTKVVFVQHDGQYVVLNFPGDKDTAEAWREQTMAITETRISLSTGTVTLDPRKILVSFCIEC